MPSPIALATSYATPHAMLVTTSSAAPPKASGSSLRRVPARPLRPLPSRLATVSSKNGSSPGATRATMARASALSGACDGTTSAMGLLPVRPAAANRLDQQGR